jgi:seryl-tRNA synthetase
MLDLNLIRNNPDLVRQSLINRQKNPQLLDEIISFEKELKPLLRQIEDLRSQQNKISREIKGQPSAEQIQQATQLKNQLKELDQRYRELEVKQLSLLEEIPNIPAEDVPVGKDDSENVVIKTVGTPPSFSFPVLDHVDLGEKLDIIDVKKAGELSGARFGYFKNEGAVLEMAVMFYAFKKLVAKGYKAMVPPAMIKSKTEWGCGYASNKNLYNAYYSIPEDDLIFISSSEHAVVPYHSNEILSSDILPLKYINFSPCFRREAGAYGKDTRGLFRVHFFNKVEMNAFTLPDTQVSDQMCLELLANEEELMQELGLTYQVYNCCTGDLPQPNRRMYDINTWFPGQNAYRETQSCSNCTDYQARRLNTKVKLDNKNEYVHILNATLITDRAVLAIIENFQQEDGSVKIPQVLVPYTGFDLIKPKKP